MNTEDMKTPKPPLFKMKEPFDNMGGAKILVSHLNGRAIGTIVCFRRTQEGLFGVRIDVMRPPVMNVAFEPAKPGEWQTIGTFTVESLCLNQAAISAIRKADSLDYSFELPTSHSTYKIEA
jgi:hypothetical protein